MLPALPTPPSLPQPLMRGGTQGPYEDGYANPGGTSPAPAPLATGRPVGYWESLATSLAFATGETRITAVWGSTLFDLRTDLRGVASRELQGTPLNRTSAVQMWIAIQGLSNNHLGMSVEVSHWGHPVDATKAAQFTAWANVTADIATGTDLVILDYFPPGSGYQMRHWQLKLRFSFPRQGAPATLPILQIQAGVY